MAKLSNEDFINKVSELVGEEYSVETEYKNMSSKVGMVHNKCGHHYQVKATSFIHSGSRCPNCRGKKRVTQSMFEDKIQSRGFTIVGTFKNYSTKVEVEHTCGYSWEVQPSNLYRDISGCPSCAGNARLTNEDFINRVNTMYPKGDYIFLEEYKGYCKKIECKHTCGYRWNITPGNFLRGKTCPKCEGSMKLTNEEIVTRMEELFKGEYVFTEDYINSDTPIMCRHTCGHKWKVRPYNIFGGRKCPKCYRESKREKLISEILDTYSIDYVREKTFEGCRHRGLLRFDFYIPNLSIAIEYDGEHHFIDYRYTQSNNSLSLVQKRDAIKDRYCKENYIKLYRIPYTKTDEEIKEIVLKIINVSSNAKGLTTKQVSQDIV